MSGGVKSVDLRDFAKELGVYSDHSIKELRDAAAKGIAKSIPDLVKASPVDTGLYAASWDMTVTEEAIILGNYSPYAGIIEHGTRPFTPPLAPLLAWAKRVLSGQHGVSTGQPETDYSDEVWALARYTQKKIAEHGMVPRHVMENTLPTIMRNIREEMLKIA